MSRVPGKRLPGATSTVINEQPRALLENATTLVAPSLASLSELRRGGSAQTALAGVGNTLAVRGVDMVTSNPYGQLGVRAFTEGINTNDGHINPAFGEAMTEGTGRLMSDMIGEETMAKMEQRYAKAVDKVTEVEMSAGQIAMAGRLLDYLAPNEVEVPAVDVPDAGEMSNAFSSELLEPEADVVVTDLYELDAEQLGKIAGTAATAGFIPQMELSTQEVTIEQAEEECCTCCAYDESGQGGDCGFCDCEDDAQGECDDCLVM